MSSSFEAGSHLRLTDFVYHSTLGLRVIKKKGLRALGDPEGWKPCRGGGLYRERTHLLKDWGFRG